MNNQKVKEVAKKFWDNNWPVLLGATLSGVSIMIGYAIGEWDAARKIQCGLDKCFLVKPELKDVLDEALDLAEKRTNG